MKNRVTLVKLPPERQTDFYFIISDIHSDKLHMPSYDIMKQHAEMHPKGSRRLIINGDGLECEFLMGKPTDFRKWAKNVPFIEGLIEKADEEMEWANNFLDDLQKTFDYIYWLDGNHCWRYWNWMENFCPYEYRHNFDHVKRIGLEERGIPYIPYPDYLDIGMFTIMHGTKHGQNHNKQHYQMVEGRDLIYGHVHHNNTTSFPTRGRSRKVYSMPCMSDLGPEYQLKRGENNWAHGYGVLNMRWDGEGFLNIFEPYKGMLPISNGEIIRARNYDS